jgi:hypothetical protein
MVLPDAQTAFGAQTEAILDGSPIGSIGPLFVGLAPDGVEEQPVALRDGSEIQAPVVNNVYAVTDPSWTPPQFVGASERRSVGSYMAPDDINFPRFKGDRTG